MNADSRRAPSVATLCLCVFVVFVAAFGCHRNAGPARYDLTGTITYAGKPVPAGYILFAPDKSKGNDGPGADAEIKDGVYHTRLKEGTVGGPHVATINGFDGSRRDRDRTSIPWASPCLPTCRSTWTCRSRRPRYDMVVPAQKAK